MKTNTHPIAWAFIALFLLILPSFAMASEGEPAAGPAYAGIVEMLAPVVALGVTALLRHVAKVPTFLLPVIAAAAGAGYTYISAKLGALPDVSLINGALLGLAATGLHQLKVQLGKAIDESPVQ